MEVNDLNKIKRVYMIGIGGIGMSALARFFMKQGKAVSGYDRVSTRLTDELIREGSQIRFTTDLPYIKENYPNSEDLLIIYTPAIPYEHLEMEFFRKGGYRMVKRAEMLGILTEGEKCIAVAGTHGKTTVSTMMAHLLITAGLDCNAFLGGISRNYGTNAIFSKNKGLFVLEADEFDRSFLNLHPDMAVITSCDPDHLDVYGTGVKMQNTYCQFISQIPDGGTLVHRVPLELECLDQGRLDIRTYSAGIEADFSAINIRFQKDHYCFDVETPSGVLKDVHLGIPGRINVENALSVIGISRKLGLDDEILKKALRSFTGVARRFDVRISREDLIYIDDYAHHPKELDACIQSVRDMYPGRKITGIFQPHLFSRTRDFAVEFAESLQQLDELILLDIYPAREKPMKGISSKIIFDRVRMEQKMMITRERLIMVMAEKKPEILLTLGAGDIEEFVSPLENLYRKEDKS
ncbi:UDP-N-acetylmuramate--L-alanine ligase [subsurface metagenome]